MGEAEGEEEHFEQEGRHPQRLCGRRGAWNFLETEEKPVWLEWKVSGRGGRDRKLGAGRAGHEDDSDLYLQS